MAQGADFKRAAEEILKAVGGKENVSNVTHCMTRLRFNFKDESIVKEEEIKKIPGIMGVTKAGGQLQVIIGQSVEKIYDIICALGNFQQTEKIDENLDAPKKKVTFASVGNSILDALAGCLTPLIPLLLAASLFKMLVAVLGPTMLNVMSDSSDLYKLFTIVGDAGFYFLPIAVGFTAAKKFNVTPVIGMFVGAIMLHPTFVAMAADATTKFTVFGIPCHLANYSSTILPVILSVWVMSYIEKFFKKHLPTTLKTVFAPFLTVFIMLPIALCVLGPAGSFIGNYICNGLLGFSKFGGVFAILVIAIIGALWEFLVISGMHFVLITALILVITTNGNESIVLPGALAASLSVSGMCLGAAFRIKNKEERSLAIGYFVAALIGGVTEPGLYGLGIRFKRPFLGMMIGGFVGGLYAGIVHASAYVLVPVASFLGLTSFAGGSTANLVNGIITGVIALVVAAIATYFLGFKKNDPLII